ncbi:hypothetical protein BC830DRAFT_1134642 [Chytriomyces sp. MP71]|nr:hypothetical protein BC830DRAFT_1134642 [Chytriomyces sp. MP71]
MNREEDNEGGLGVDDHRLQLADLMDVAAGAAWAESEDGESDGDGGDSIHLHSSTLATLPAKALAATTTRDSKLLMLLDTSGADIHSSDGDGGPGAVSPFVTVSAKDYEHSAASLQFSHDSLHRKYDTHPVAAPERVVLLAPPENTTTNTSHEKSSSSEPDSFASLFARLNSTSVSDDVLASFSHSQIEAHIETLARIRARANHVLNASRVITNRSQGRIQHLQYPSDQARPVWSGVGPPYSTTSSNQPTPLLSLMDQKVVDLITRIDFEISIAEQFRASNADHLKIEAILQEDAVADDESIVSSQLLSSETPLERIALPSSFNTAALGGTDRNTNHTFSAPPNSPHYQHSNRATVEIPNGSTASQPLSRSPSSAMLMNGSESVTLAGTIARNASLLSRQTSSLGESLQLDGVFKWTPLARLSSDMLSSATTPQYGMPTVFAVSGMIAVGTSRGIILLYNLSQALQSVLGDPGLAADYGAISSLAFSPDQTRVVAGHARGWILVWDLARRGAGGGAGGAGASVAPLRVIEPLSRVGAVGEDLGPKRGHYRGAKVVHVSFVGNRMDVLSADNEGSAFHHTITSLLMLSTITTTQLAGNQPIYAIQPLPRGGGATAPTARKATAPHSSDRAGIVAVATPFRLTFMRLRPTPVVVSKVQVVREGNSGAAAGSELPAAVEEAGCTCAALAWLPTAGGVDEAGNAASADPRLAATFGNRLIIYKVGEAASKVTGVGIDTSPAGALAAAEKAKPEFEVSEEANWNSDEPIVAVKWINSRTLVLLTSYENVIVFDSVRMLDLERCSVRHLSIVSHDSYSRGLEDYGITPQMAFLHSFQSYKGRLFVLGLEALTVASLMNWSDRLTNLVKRGNYKAAIQMATEFYDGSSHKAVSGLPKDVVTREKAVSTFLSHILSTYVSMSLSNTDFEMSPTDLVFSRDLASTCFTTCLLIQDEDLLFGDIYECFSEAGVSGQFLEELEEYVLKEALSVPLNRPGIIQELVNYFIDKTWFTRLEQLIIHMDPRTMDINQIIRLCEHNAMYSALIFVYNHSVKDYVTPLVCLLRPLGEAIKRGKLASFDAGYIIFVYLAYILTGKAFPVGTLTRREALRAKSDLYNFLFSTTHTSWPPEDGSGQQSTYVDVGCEPYPYVRLLLQYDAKEFLSMLSLAFEDGSLDGEIRLRDGHAQDGRVRFADMYSELNRQFIVDTLLVLLHSELSDPVYAASPTDYVLLNIFIVKAYARYAESQETGRTEPSRGLPALVQLPPQTTREIFDNLLLCTDEASREDRQLALLSLLRVYNPARTNGEREALLATCEKVRFWRISEHLYKQAGQYEMVIWCYLNDEQRKMDLFACLLDLLVGGALEYSQTYSLKQHILDSLVLLIEVDGMQTATLVCTVFPSENDDVIRRLEYEPRAQYLYLKGLLGYEAQQAETALIVASTRDGGVNRRRSMARLRSKASQVNIQGGALSSPRFNVHICNLFLRLMIQFESASVLPFLIGTADTTPENPYEFETVLQYCLDAHLKEPALWMLERAGQVARALDIILKSLKDFVDSCITVVTREESDASPSSSPANSLDLYGGSNPFAERSDALSKKRIELHLTIQNLNKEFDVGLGLCQRKALSLDRWECESIWFRLLDAILEPHQTLRSFAGAPIYDSANTLDGSQTPVASSSDSLVVQLINALRQLLRRAIASMSLQVKLPAMLLHLLYAMEAPRFGELRKTIFIMLEEYSFERELLTTANRIISKDAHSLNTRLVSEKHRAVRPMKGQCGVCRRLLHIDTAGERVSELQDRFIVFECRHIFHERCLRSEIQSANPDLEGILLGDKDMWCVVCEVLNENGVRRHKKDIVSRLLEAIEKGKGKAVRKPIDFKQKVAGQPELLVDLDRIYALLDLQPLPSEIFNSLTVREVAVEDRISLNESFDDTETSSSSVNGSAMFPIHRRIAPPVLRLLDSSLKKFNLVLEPPLPSQ